eukprot:2868407-Pyramimonas_sp.AAC.1
MQAHLKESLVRRAGRVSQRILTSPVFYPTDQTFKTLKGGSGDIPRARLFTEFTMLSLQIPRQDPRARWHPRRGHQHSHRHYGEP